MNDAEVKSSWQDQKGYRESQDPMDKNMTKLDQGYQQILRNILLLHDRSFQIGLYIFLTVVMLLAWWREGDQQPVAITWINFFCVAGFWIIFIVYERLRRRIRLIPEHLSLLAHLEARRRVIISANRLYLVVIAQFEIFMLLLCAASFFKNNGNWYIAGMVCLSLILPIPVLRRYRRVNIPVREHIDYLIAALSQEQNTERQ